MPGRTGFHTRPKFRVEIQGFTIAAFRTCSELSMEFGKIQYREGGAIIPDQSPGLAVATDLTLERGITNTFEMFEWFTEVLFAGGGIGLPVTQIRRDLDIVQLERDDSVLLRWRLFNCWPMKFVGGEWDNEAEEVVIESITLAYDFPILVV